MNSAYSYCPLCAQPLATRELAGLPRRACSACDYVHWDNPLPVVAAVVEYDGHIVLARGHGWEAKKFGLIAGFLERGETPEAAVAREVKEELDLDSSRVDPIGVYAFERKNELILAYHVLAAGTIRLNEELAEFRLIAPEKLRAWDSGTGLAIRDWLQSRGYAA